MDIPKDNLIIPKSHSWKMFDDISSQYDPLNHILSLGLDILWRKRLVNLAPSGRIKILDLATGTGDVLLTFAEKRPDFYSAIGIDLADRMMRIGAHKVKQRRLHNKISFKHADATSLPFPDTSFDVTTISFGIRNIPDYTQALKEMRRILKPEGKALILEFSLPENIFIRFFHLLYLRIFVPLIGFVLTGNYSAYRYLNQTIESFPYGKEFCGLMEQAQFRNVKSYRLLFGAATIYEGQK
jgi:demethylmenaquinone methyltransferase / 2-methoxy-6-polyprenyl-1,4-benzoquinol methylase